MRARHLLLTGSPGIGKTTVVRPLAERLPLRLGGFYTEEIREAGGRQGFRAIAWLGRA
jgi:nucleoside-triphosphatase THEP1